MRPAWVGVAAACIVFGASVTGRAQDDAAVLDAAPETESAEDVHAALRELRDGLMAAWQARDMERLLAYVDENVVVTWQNAQVVRGHAGLRAFYEEMLSGDDAILRDVTSRIEVDELSIVHGGDTAIAFGTMRDELTLRGALARAPFVDGSKPLRLASRWTATLVKQDGRWRLASYHTSADLFDNPVLELARGSTLWIAGATAVGGLVLGVALMLLLRRLGRGG